VIVTDQDFAVPGQGSPPQMPLLSVASQLISPEQVLIAAGHAVGLQLVA
jgi:hypothetical protein